MAITDNEERTPNGNAHPFNMLDALAELKEAGFEQEKAEAVVRMQYRIVESNLASKWDLALVRKDIKELDTKVETLKENIEKEIRVLGYQSTIKMGSLGLVFLGLLIAFAKMGLLSIK